VAQRYKKPRNKWTAREPPLKAGDACPHAGIAEAAVPESSCLKLRADFPGQSKRYLLCSIADGVITVVTTGVQAVMEGQSNWPVLWKSCWKVWTRTYLAGPPVYLVNINRIKESFPGSKAPTNFAWMTKKPNRSSRKSRSNQEITRIIWTVKLQ